MPDSMAEAWDETDHDVQGAAEKGGDFTDGAEWVLRRWKYAIEHVPAPCPKGCIEKESGLPHPAHKGRCGLPTGRLGVVSCYCVTP